jgi:hypothetical protein
VLKEETPSIPPETLPALATYTLELLGRMAACVGITPRLGALGLEVGVSAMIESPETSICKAPPGLFGVLVLMAICRNGRGLHRTPGNPVLRAGNDYGTIDLATRHHQQGGKHHGRQSAHTSKTHQHPKGKVLVTRF